MFYSEFSGKLIGPNVKCCFVPIETRPKIYYEIFRGIDENGNQVLIPGKEIGRGFETVREIQVSPDEVELVQEKLNGKQA